MAKKRATRKYKKIQGANLPKYNFPGCGSLLLALVALALLAAVGVTVVGTPVVQEMAHPEVRQMVQP